MAERCISLTENAVEIWGDMIQTRKLHGVFVIVWSFRDNTAVLRESIQKNDKKEWNIDETRKRAACV